MKKTPTEWYREHRKPCLDCGQLVNPRSSRCRSCSQKMKGGWKRPDLAEGNRLRNPLRRGSLNPNFGKRANNWNGGHTKNADGYILIRFPGHPRASNKGYVFEHVLVMEKKLGRPLAENELVHHIDFDKTNNDPNNLMLFDNDGKHLNYHKYFKRKEKP